MIFEPGARLGPYEILSSLGAGGMGEVYKARDTRLDCIVAIRLLPAHHSGDSQLRERFDREAREISALDHSHICALYEVGEHEGASFLVTQYLEGQTLADRIAKGPLPVGDALTIAMQVTDALKHAHQAGIVHRDLDPGNIFLTESGAKLLDFGLAKMPGTDLGTFQYMAPEQLEGADSDPRTDIFAFGAVVYEMLTGRKAFEGKSQASLIGAILKDPPPPIAATQPLTPPELEHVIRTCLAKDPDERWQTAGDIARQLKRIADAGWLQSSQSAPSQSSVVPPAPVRKSRETLAWTAAVAGVLGTVAALALGRLGYLGRAGTEPGAYRASIVLPDGLVFAPNAVPANRLALSPDGRRLAMIAATADQRVSLYVRPLDSLTAQAIAATDSAVGPFWSPDSGFIAFVSQGKLKKIDGSGGPPVPLADSTSSGYGAWNRDDVILFTPARGPIFRVSASGGPASAVTALDAKRGEVQHLYPAFLPDGRHFLYTAVRGEGGASTNALYLASLDKGEPPRLLVDGAATGKYAERHLLYVKGRTLFAHAFDAGSLAFRGEAVPIAEQLEHSSSTGPPR